MVFNLLNGKIKDALGTLGYSVPTLPQEMAIPKVLAGKNVLVLSPTGFGKTEAVMLGLFDKIMREPDAPGVRGLYITPLRSLNRDMFDRLLKIGEHLDISIDLRHGDTTQKMRRQQILDPSQIMITTPETMQALLVGTRTSEILKNVEWIVIDEIHELYGNKRGSQLSITLERLARITKKKFQRIGLSATIGDPVHISKYLVGSDGECEIVDARALKDYDITLEMPKPTAEDSLLSSKLGTTDNGAFCLRRIKELVESHTKIIVFTNTRESAESIGARFKKWLPDFPIAVHHSSLSKEVRLDVETRFKTGELKAVISTSSLELGIDIGKVDLVVQYGSPRQVTKLIQRVGRSGHMVGRVSKGIILCNSSQDYLEAGAIIKEMKKAWLEKPVMPEKPYDVLAHQAVGICMDFNVEERNPTAQDVYSIISKAYPYSKMSLEEVEKVILFMKEIHLIGEDPGQRLYRTRKGLLYYFQNLSTIPHEKDYNVISVELNKKVGVLHQGFVSQYIKNGAEFIMKGEPWKVAEFDGEKINVVSSKNSDSAVPSWEGELIPVAREVASLASDMRIESKFPDMDDQRKRFVVPDSKIIYIEKHANTTIVHSCFGNRVNETLARVISAIISSKTGMSVVTRCDTYRITFKIEYAGQTLVSDAIKELHPEWIENLVSTSIKNTPVFEYRFYQIAKRFGVVMRDAVFSPSTLPKLVDIFKTTPLYDETVKEIYCDKLDINGATDVVRKIHNGEIKIIDSASNELSPLGMAAVDYSSVYLLKNSQRAKELVKLVEDRLNKKKLWFGCARCGETLGTYEVAAVPDKLECPKCSSKLIGFVHDKDKVLTRKALNMNPKELDNEEYRLVERFRESAEIFLTDGKTSCFVMAGFGVGPATARRILRGFYKTREELVMAIIEAEKTFASNKQFW